MKRQISALFVFSLILFVSTASSSCRSTASRREGPDPFGDSACEKGALKTETDGRFLLQYGIFRKRFEDQRASASLVIAGDSLAALFLPELMSKNLPGTDAINRGIPGDTTAFLFARLEADVIPLRPRNLVLSIGGNDILQGRCLSNVLSFTLLTIKALHEKLPDTRVILTSIPPTNSPRANEIVPFFNARMKEAVASDPRTVYLDLWPALSESDRPQLREEFWIKMPDGTADSVHFNEKAYEVWGAMIMRIIKN